VSARPRWLGDLRRAVSWHRRLLAAGLAAAAVAMAVGAMSPTAAPTVAVLAAARDLPGGLPLSAGDLHSIALPPEVVPAGALRPGDDVTGRLLAGPARRGEPLTDARLLGPGLLAGYPDDLVAAPVRIADGGAVSLLRAGDRVDVLAADPSPYSSRTDPAYAEGDGTGRSGGSAVARVVASAVRVLTVPQAPDGGPLGGGGGYVDGALVVLAVTPAVAAELASAEVSARLSVLLRPG
jgi:Flp pilus assembly protein CpaB